MTEETSPPYDANIRLGLSASLEVIEQVVTASGRRAHLLARNKLAGNFILMTRKALLGQSRTTPRWRTIDTIQAENQEDLLKQVAPEIRALFVLLRA